MLRPWSVVTLMFAVLSALPASAGYVRSTPLSNPIIVPSSCSTIFDRARLETLTLSASGGESSRFGGISYSDLSLTLPKNHDLLGDLKEILVRGGSDRKVVETVLERAFTAKASTISLRQVSPHFVRLMTGIMPVGPNGVRECASGNCWNATLNWFDSESGIFMVAPEDMEHSLETEFRALPLGAPLRFGDVMVIRSGSSLLHTATYINDEFVWNKLAFYNEAAYEFRRTTDMMATIHRTFKNIKVSYARKKNARPEDHAFHTPERRSRHRHPSDSWG